MASAKQCWLTPWREVKSDTFYPSPGLIRLRDRHRLRTPVRPMDAREADALMREALAAREQFYAEVDQRVDRLLDDLLGPEPSPDEPGSP